MKACPDCDHYCIYFRKFSGDYRCKRCGSTFKIPNERDRAVNHSATIGLAVTLEQMDPGEI